MPHSKCRIAKTAHPPAETMIITAKTALSAPIPTPPPYSNQRK